MREVGDVFFCALFIVQGPYNAVDHIIIAGHAVADTKLIDTHITCLIADSSNHGGELRRLDRKYMREVIDSGAQ